MCAGAAVTLACAAELKAAQPDSIASPTARVHAPREWAADPRVPGENLPPAGRSLFDYLVVHWRKPSEAYDVPFPFSKLMAKLAVELQPEGSSGPVLKSVLIPLGRSLQRNSAAPEFFGYPRAVVAADAEPRMMSKRSGMLLKNRIYLGYQEKQNLIEVISYNETAGRFEFQVVKDYRAGGRPQVLYANRAVCIACHQNAAPLFSRQVWDETNANPRIAALLRKQKRTFYGIEPDRGVDIPYAFDNATDRANLYSAYQLLWRAGCASRNDEEQAMRCRAGLFTAALQYRLSGGQQFDQWSKGFSEHVAPVLAANARERWPDGLQIPNPDIPNRDPFMTRSAQETAIGGPGESVGVQVASFVESADVIAPFDPLLPRPPLETWSISDPLVLRRFVAGLSEFLADVDVRRLDEYLYRAASRRSTPRTTYAAKCEIRRASRSTRQFRIDFDCRSKVTDSRRAVAHGRFYIRNGAVSAGAVERLQLVDGERKHELTHIDVRGGTVGRSGGRAAAVTLKLARAGVHARLSDGHAVDSMRIEWPQDPMRDDARDGSSQANAAITVVQDFQLVHMAIEHMVRDGGVRRLDVFSDLPFRRASLMPALFARLGMKPLAWCCSADASMPPPLMESHTSPAHTTAEAEARPAALQPFFRYCATCHQSNDRSPPNFLQGSGHQVAANLAHCAQRLYVRLSMWKIAPEQRQKTPMPPHYALQGLRSTPEAWPDSSELLALRAYVERTLYAETGKSPRTDELMSHGYENLRACLP